MRIRMLLAVTVLVAAGLPALSVPNAAAEAVAQEMSYACALKSNGLLRHVTTSRDCTRNERLITVKPGPVRVCVQPDGSVRLTSNLGKCKPPAAAFGLTLPPTSGVVYFCASASQGVLRHVTSPSECDSSETAVMVTPNDAAPTVASTAPSGGASGVAVDTDVTVTFSESVTASATAFGLVCDDATEPIAVSGAPGTILTLDPASDLPEGATCTVTVVATGIGDTDTLDPPDNLVADHVFSFTTDSAPTVTATSPEDLATAVDPSGDITVTFSEPVDATASSFTLECPAGSVAGFAVTGSGTATITLDPSADLPAATTCRVTVLADGITDADSGDPPDALAANHAFSFTTADAAPTVLSAVPADGAVSVATNTNVTVTFSESVTASSASFSINCEGANQPFAVSGSPGTVVTLDPTGDLPEGTACTVTVLASESSDTDTVDPPDHLAADHVLSFTTDAAPTVTSTTPTDGASGVDPADDITVDFSEAVTVSTGSFTVSCNDTAQPFSVTGSGTASITLDPDSNLPSTASCTVTALAAAVADVDAGDPPGTMSANHEFSFETRDAAPAVTGSAPADGATDVARGTGITITFSEPVTATGNSFAVECPTGSPHAFSVAGSGTSSLTLDPSSSLPSGATCTVSVVADEISDVDTIDPPDHLTADDSFTFTVAANQAPTDISLSDASVDENAAAGTPVGTLSASDADAGDTFTFSLVDGTGDTDNASFEIVGDSLRTGAAFDFETKSTYSIRVRATDSGAASFDKVLTISVNDLNEAPTDLALSTTTVEENEPANTVVGALSTTDPDTGDTFTYSLVSGTGSTDNGSFDISGDQLRVTTPLNYEAKDTYSIRVRTTDAGSLTFDQQFTVTVIDVNDPPVATADAYSGAVGNTVAVVGTTATGPRIALTGNVLTGNDTDEDTTFPHTVTAVAETVTSTGGGTATINTDGSFVFLPGVGDKNQNDTFTYQATDGTATATGTVTVGIANALVWYVDNGATPTGPDGRSTSPFTSLSPLNGAGGAGDADGTGDHIFVYQGSGALTGGLTLEASQKLWGQPFGLTVNNGAGNVTVLAAGGTNPTIQGGLTLASAVDVQGVTLGSTSGFAISGTGVGASTIGQASGAQVAITNASGGGVSLATGTPTVVLSSLTSSGGSNGISLSGLTGGSVTVNGGAITGATGADVLITGGSADVTYAGTITNSAGRSIDIQNRAGGTVTLSGAISDTGQGVFLNSNSGATVSFTGGITASTGTNPAFSATGGGTVTATGTTNSLTTTTGTALNVTDTTIGSTGLTFRSISANGATNGIVLNNTGTSGGLSVTGDGSTASSGGTIQNTAGPGGAGPRHPSGQNGNAAVMLTKTGNVSLKFLRILSPRGNGILADDITGTSNVIEKSVIDYNNTVIANAFGLRWEGYGTSADVTLALDATTFQNKGDGTTAVSLSAMGQATNGSKMAFNIKDSNTADSFESKYTRLFGSGVVVGAGDSASSTARVSTSVSDTKFVNAWPVDSSGNPTTGGTNNLEFGVSASGVLDLQVTNNTFDDVARPLANAGVINVNSNDTGQVGSAGNPARIAGNTVQNIGSQTSFTGGYIGMRFALQSTSPTTHRLVVANNRLLNVVNKGILLSSRDKATANVRIDDTTGTGNPNGIGNTIGTTAAPVGLNNHRAIDVDASDTTTMNLLVQNNPSIVGDGSSSANSSFSLTSGIPNNTSNPSATLNATVTNNVVRNVNASAGTSGRFRARTMVPSGGSNTSNMCLDLRNNQLEDGSKLFVLEHASNGTFGRNTVGNTGTISSSGTFGAVSSCPQPLL